LEVIMICTQALGRSTAVGATLLALSTAALAAPSLTRIIEVPGGSYVYEDADNGTAGAELKVYYVPTTARVARNADGTPQWSFRTLPDGASEASFVLHLAPDASLERGAAGVKADVAGRYHVDAATVHLLPMPLLQTRFSTFASGDDFVDPLLPADGTPASGGLAFYLPMTAAGSHWFKHNVVQGGLQFAVMQGDAYLLDEFAHELTSHQFRIPLYLHDVPFCAVVAEPCRF
jgi:hypothetical protein